MTNYEQLFQEQMSNPEFAKAYYEASLERISIPFPKQADIKASFALIKAKVSVSIEDMENAIRNRASRDCD